MWYNANANRGVETVYNDRGLVGILKDHITNTRTRYEYDMAGRPVHVRRTTGSEYDRDMSLGELFYFFDDRTNRLAQYRVLFPFASSTFDYTYGDITAGEIPDNLYSLSHNGTTEIEYEYDEQGRLGTRTLGLALCVACIFFGSCAENAISNWISGYMENALDIDKAIGDILGVALFAVLLGIAHIAYARFGKRISSGSVCRLPPCFPFWVRWYRCAPCAISARSVWIPKIKNSRLVDSIRVIRYRA